MTFLDKDFHLTRDFLLDQVFLDDFDDFLQVLRLLHGERVVLYCLILSGLIEP